MACTEHKCSNCDYHEFSNETLKKCPECGSPVSNWFDEDGDQPDGFMYPEDDEDSYEEDDYDHDNT